MTRESQKHAERHYLDRFLATLSPRLAGTIEARETPDFIVGAATAIEIVRYFRPTPSNRRPLQEQEALRRELVARAQALYPGPPRRVSIHFSHDTFLSKHRISSLAKALAGLVSGLSIDLAGHKEISWEDGLDRLPEITSVDVYQLPPDVSSPWTSPDAGYLESLGPQAIQSIIDTKSRLLPTYPTGIDSRWLLIVVDGFAISSMVEVHHDLVQYLFDCPFDKLFVFDDFHKKHYELRGRRDPAAPY